MELIKSNITDNTLYIFPIGRIDSSNAEQTEKEIFDVCENTYSNIIIDASELEYISSAGLRILLRLRKKEPSLKIINTSSDVYEIFEMTGFTEIIPTEKAYRKISVDGCEVIGRGANGKVYRLDSDTIIKVYENPDSLPDIQRERELARKAFVSGIPTAIPYDVVRVGNSYGSVFELLNANSFAALIMENPDKLDEYIGLFVDLMKKIHSTEVQPDDMPDMKKTAINWAIFLKDYLPENVSSKLISLVEAVPECHYMLHGDYHVKNVMMQNGEVLLIDMDTLCYGHPVFELASVFNAFVGFHELDRDTMSFMGIPYEISNEIWKKLLPLYLGTADESVINAVAEKASLVGYTRLLRRLIRRNGFEDEQGRKEIEFYTRRITELTEKIDSLSF